MGSLPESSRGHGALKLLTAVLLMVPALALGQAQAEVRPRTINWYDLAVLIKQDSSDVLMLLKADSALAHERGGRTSFESFDPQAALAWVGSARELLGKKLGARDTGDVRSVALQTRRGAQVLLLRRRYNGAWTYERFLAISDSAAGSRGALLLDLGEPRMYQLLDSLESFARAMTRRRP